LQKDSITSITKFRSHQMKAPLLQSRNKSTQMIIKRKRQHHES